MTQSLLCNPGDMDMCSLALELEQGIASQWRVHWGSVRDMGLGMRLMRLKRVPWEIGVGAGLVKSGKGCGRDCLQCSSAEHQIAQR